MQKIILSPPFSNIKILSCYKRTSRIFGTYTLNPRPGLWRVLTTLKKTENGWVNNVGLRNPGIAKAKSGIISIAELKAGDFDLMLSILADNPAVDSIEFNISCPNADVLNISRAVLDKANILFDNVIVKIPHVLSDDKLFKLLDTGDFIIHVSNTKQTDSGALSGTELVCRNLSSISKIKKYQPERKVLAGGGIYNLDTLLDYKDVGAEYFSLSTILLNPFKTFNIINKFYKLSS